MTPRLIDVLQFCYIQSYQNFISAVLDRSLTHDIKTGQSSVYLLKRTHHHQFASYHAAAV